MKQYIDEKGRRAMEQWLEAHINEEIVRAFQGLTISVEVVEGRAVVCVTGGDDPRTLETGEVDLLCCQFDLADAINTEMLFSDSDIAGAVSRAVAEANERTAKRRAE